MLRREMEVWQEIAKNANVARKGLSPSMVMTSSVHSMTYAIINESQEDEMIFPYIVLTTHYVYGNMFASTQRRIQYG